MLSPSSVARSTRDPFAVKSSSGLPERVCSRNLPLRTSLHEQNLIKHDYISVFSVNLPRMQALTSSCMRPNACAKRPTLEPYFPDPSPPRNPGILYTKYAARIGNTGPQNRIRNRNRAPLTRYSVSPRAPPSRCSAPTGPTRSAARASGSSCPARRPRWRWLSPSTAG
jgi:hypothetical protein